MSNKHMEVIHYPNYDESVVMPFIPFRPICPQIIMVDSGFAVDWWYWGTSNPPR